MLFVVFLRRPLKISIKEIPSIYRYHSSDPTHGSFLPICISFPRQGFGGCDRHTNPPQERETPKQKDQLTDISLFFSIQSHKEIIPKLLFLSRTLEGGWRWTRLSSHLITLHIQGRKVVVVKKRTCFALSLDSELETNIPSWKNKKNKTTTIQVSFYLNFFQGALSYAIKLSTACWTSSTDFFVIQLNVFFFCVCTFVLPPFQLSPPTEKKNNKKNNPKNLITYKEKGGLPVVILTHRRETWKKKKKNGFWQFLLF